MTVLQLFEALTEHYQRVRDESRSSYQDRILETLF